MKRPVWFQRGLLKLAGVSQSYTPEQLANAGKTWNWNPDYKQEQKDSDILDARKLWQGNGYGTEAVNLLSNSVIGKTGIIVQFQQESAQDAWDTHQWNAQHPDFLGFTNEQRIVMQNLAIDGDSFVHYIHHEDGVFNEHIDSLMVPRSNGKTLGIERDRLGRPILYDVRDDNNQIQKIPASRICHTYWSNFSATRRGISMIRGAIDPLNALREVTRDYRQAVRVLMAFRALVKYKQNMPDIPKKRLPDGTTIVDLDRLSRMIQIAPDKMPLIPDGLDFVQPEQTRLEPELFVSLKKALLSEAARACRISYFSLASDLEGANFSSLRQGVIEDKDVFYWLLSMLLSFVARSVREWMQWAVLQPDIDSIGLLRNPPEFFMPSFEFIDPAKHALAMKTMFGIGGISLTEIIRMEGRNPDETFRLRAEDAKKLQEYKEKYGIDIGGNGEPGPEDDEGDDGADNNPDDEGDDDNSNPNS